MRDKRILITGSSKGLGLELARHYSGANTVFGLSRSESTFDHPRYRHFRCDLSDAEQIDASVSTIRKEHGGVDLLINNAAVLTSLPLVAIPPKGIQAMVDTNFTGAVLLSRAVLRQMQASGSGRIINITSMSPRVKVAGDSVYAATKAALETFSAILNREVCRYGIRVNCLAISGFSSGMLAQIIESDAEKILKHIPHGKLVPMEEVIRSIDFLSWEGGSDIGGQVLSVGGV